MKEMNEKMPYQKAEMQVIEIQKEQFIATSTPQIDDTGYDGPWEQIKTSHPSNGFGPTVRGRFS